MATAGSRWYSDQARAMCAIASARCPSRSLALASDRCGRYSSGSCAIADANNVLLSLQREAALIVAAPPANTTASTGSASTRGRTCGRCVASGRAAQAVRYPASMATPTLGRYSVRSASSCPVGTSRFDAGRKVSPIQPSAMSGRRSPRRAASAAHTVSSASTAIERTAATVGPLSVGMACGP